jgi:fructan beta-fructosidase
MLKITSFASIVFLLSVLYPSTVPAQQTLSPRGKMDEPLRPQYQFTPPSNWNNDPNGLVYYQGEYHLFYQYYPDSMRWGPMHWGHAVSLDMLHWKDLPIAMYKPRAARFPGPQGAVVCPVQKMDHGGLLP